jgi:hypothetical protein
LRSATIDRASATANNFSRSLHHCRGVADVTADGHRGRSAVLWRGILRDLRM